MPHGTEADLPASAPVAGEARPYGWLYDWTHSSATGRPDEHYTTFTLDEAHAKKHDNPRAVYIAAPQASAEALEVARAALMEIADLADVEADQRGVIVNQALTKIARMTAAPQADKDGAQQRAGDAYEALNWYAEQVGGCRKFGPDGEAARHALDRDGGERARAALSATQPEQGERDA